MEKITKNLIQFGLGESEAKIYLAVLQCGQANTTDIAKTAGIGRTTLYPHINALLQNDLLRKIIKGKRTYYIAQKPDRIFSMLEQRKKKAREILPLLTSLYNSTSQKPVVKFYENKDGMRKIYREMTRTSHCLWSIFAADRYYATFTQKDGEEFINNIRNEGGKLCDLVKDTPEGRCYVKKNVINGIGTAKLLPKDLIFDVDLLVAGNKVAMISLPNLIGIIIEDAQIAHMQRTFLKFIWRSVGR